MCVVCVIRCTTVFLFVNTAPTIIDISAEIEGTIAGGAKRILEYIGFPDEGFTLEINIPVGGLQVYGSFEISNPTSLTADFEFSVQIDINYFVSPELRPSTCDDVGMRRRRQANNVTLSNNLYLSIVGLEDNNTFSLNTTIGDTSSAAGTIILTNQEPIMIMN